MESHNIISKSFFSYLLAAGILIVIGNNINISIPPYCGAILCAILAYTHAQQLFAFFCRYLAIFWGLIIRNNGKNAGKEKLQIDCCLMSIESVNSFQPSPPSPLEPAKWLNRVFAQAWPFTIGFGENELKTLVLNRIAEQYDVRVGAVDFGHKPPIVCGWKCHDRSPIPKNNDAKEDENDTGKIVLDLDLLFESNSLFEFKKYIFTAGIRNLAIRGLLCLEMDRFQRNSVPPFFELVTVFFYTAPDVEYEFTDLAIFLRIFDIEEAAVRAKINSLIAEKMVYPNKISFPIRSGSI